jgi:hypothetical protein
VKPSLSHRPARIARIQAKRPAAQPVRIEYANDSDPAAETAIDRWLRSLLDSPAASGERRKP